jgi:hypothetical protein
MTNNKTISGLQVTHKKLPEDGTWMPKHVGGCVSNKGVII